MQMCMGILLKLTGCCNLKLREYSLILFVSIVVFLLCRKKNPSHFFSLGFLQEKNESSKILKWFNSQKRFYFFSVRIVSFISDSASFSKKKKTLKERFSSFEILTSTFKHMSVCTYILFALKYINEEWI